MGEMKSAFEKALEKAEKLGKLSPEEMRERREEEYAPIGRAIADRYLGHGHNGILEEEANRYSGDEKGIVIRAALWRLGEAMGLESDEVTERAMAGMLTLRGEEKIGEISERIRSLLREYREAKRQKYEEEKEDIERRERELLHQLRISGSAVGEINLRASEAWERISRELLSPFDERLNELKQELLNLSEGT
jgi:hypothetical protein